MITGTWYWTNTPTAGASNIIAVTPVAAAVATVKRALTTAKATTKKATTAKAATAKKTTKAASSTAKVASDATKPIRGIHPLVLALVALAALGYGIYEYRHDMANAFHKFRADRAARRSHRD